MFDGYRHIAIGLYVIMRDQVNLVLMEFDDESEEARLQVRRRRYLIGWCVCVNNNPWRL